MNFNDIIHIALIPFLLTSGIQGFRKVYIKKGNKLYLKFIDDNIETIRKLNKSNPKFNAMFNKSITTKLKKKYYINTDLTKEEYVLFIDTYKKHKSLSLHEINNKLDEMCQPKKSQDITIKDLKNLIKNNRDKFVKISALQLVISIIKKQTSAYEDVSKPVSWDFYKKYLEEKNKIKDLDIRTAREKVKEYLEKK